MDPITVLGAVSGSVQLLDTAIRISRTAYDFFKSLKHAKKDVRLLQGCTHHIPIKVVRFAVLTDYTALEISRLL